MHTHTQLLHGRVNISVMESKKIYRIGLTLSELTISTSNLCRSFNLRGLRCRTIVATRCERTAMTDMFINCGNTA